MLGDTDLLRTYAESRSEAAFAELVRRNVDFVYRTALRQARQPQRAEDATQMVFIDLARKAGSLSRRTDLAGWFFLSARFAALKIARKEIRQDTREIAFERQRNALGEASPPPDWQQLEPLLDDALAGLAPTDREAVLLRYFKEASFAQIGATLSMSEEAARKRVDRATDKLRTALGRRGLVSTSAAFAAALGAQGALRAPAGLAQTATQAAITAKATVGAASALSEMVHLMSTSKAVAGLVLSAGLLMLGAGIREAWFAQRMSRQTNAALATVARMEAEAARVRHSLAQTERTRAALEQRAKAASAGNGAANEGTAAADQDGVIPKVDDPQMRTLALAQSRAADRQRYGAFFTAMKWTPAQIEGFLDARTSHVFGSVVGEATFDVRKGHDYTGYSGIMVGESDWAGAAAAEHALLGDQAFLQLANYESTQAYRQLAGDLAGKVYDSAPLTGAQGEQLVQLWASAKLSFHHGNEDDWQGLLDQAQKALTGPQMEILQKIAASQTGINFTATAAPQ
jgi:RNA polymerase sigma factor (sigma-70 family)